MKSFELRSTSSGHLAAEQKEEIRTELLKIILFYVSREINATELGQMLAFISAVQDEVLVCSSHIDSLVSHFVLLW